MKDKRFYPLCRFTSLGGLRLQTTTSTTTHTTRTRIKTLSCALFAGLVALALLFADVPAASAQSTAFTYQGQLGDHGAPASGAYDLLFSLYDAPTNGTQIGSTLTGIGISVTNGLFTEILDFGSSIFTGADRWLQIGVRTNSGTNFSLLSPRQALTPAPYAIYATTAGNVSAGAISSAQLAVNAVGPANLQSNAVTGSKIAAGQVVKSLNGLRDDVILVPGSGLSLNTSGNVLQLSANVGNYWNVQGNGGTSGANFLGTLDNQPLEFRVNNTRALRLEPTPSSPNIILGFPGNMVSSGEVGSTISGGGTAGKENFIRTTWGTIGGGLDHIIDSGSWEGTIGGGGRNRILTNAVECTIAGGWNNSIGSNSFSSVISGGAGNAIENDANDSFIAGGRQNRILAGANRSTVAGIWNTNGSQRGTIGGGANNTIETSAQDSVIAGGVFSVIKAKAIDSVIGGGWVNAIGSNSFSGVIGGGSFNTIGADAYAGTIAGGRSSTISTNAYAATISGGLSHTISAPQATIGGGIGNLIQTNASNATIAGGVQNAAGANNAAIIGGNQNTASGDTSTIGGGYLNVASGPGAFIGGGNENQAANFDSAVSGGFKNTASGETAFVGAGTLNLAGGFRGAIVGGELNQAAGKWSFIGGGYSNMASGQYSAIPGGYNNAATNDFSFAAGRRAKANHQGAFVWADATDADVASTTTNQFSVRASGGVVFYSDPTAAFGAYLPPGGGAFSSLSDRNAKTNNTIVDGRDVLERLAAIQIATWNYRSQADSVRHIGPMAQDFARAFGVGEDDKHISTVDADGVALAAIQGLNLKLQDELKKRDAENAQLKVRLDTLERMLNQIAEK
jgi:hypothetical protein